MTDANALWSHLITEELTRNGVRFFCISPGSRNTPLIYAVAHNPKAQIITHWDERGAAFHALGMAKASQHPVALICTSGTAVASRALVGVCAAAKSPATSISATGSQLFKSRPPLRRLSQGRVRG